MKRKLLLIPLYVLFFGVAFLFFFWLTLPWDRLQALVERKVEAATGYEVTMGDFGSHWFTGFEASDVVLRKPLSPELKRALAEARKARAEARKALADEGAEGGTGATGDKAERAAADEAGEDTAEGAGATDDGAEEPAKEGGTDPGEGEGEGAAKPKPELPPLPPVPPPVRIPAVKARLAVLPLLLGRLVVEVYLEIAGGTVDGTVGRAGESYLVDLEAEGLRLAAVPWLQDASPLPIKGVLEFDADVTFAPAAMRDTEGAISLTISGLQAGAGEIPLPKGAIFPSFELETPTKLGRLHLELVCGAERARDPDGALLHVVKLEHAGGDLQLRVEGDVVLKPKLGLSRPDLMLGVKFDDGFVKRNHLGIVLSNSRVKRNIKDDFLGVTLRGSFGKLEPRLSAPIWGKSRAHLRAKPGEEPEEQEGDSAEDSKAGRGKPGARGRPRRPSRLKPKRPVPGRSRSKRGSSGGTRK